MADHNVPKDPDRIVRLSRASGRNSTCQLASSDFRDQDDLKFEVVVRGQGDATHLLFVFHLELRGSSPGRLWPFSTGRAMMRFAMFP